MKHKLESRLQGGISITSDMQMTPPYGRKRRTKEPLDESKRGEWKSWLKVQHSKNKDHGIWFRHFMANRWGNNGNGERLYILRLQNHCRWSWRGVSHTQLSSVAQSCPTLCDPMNCNTPGLPVHHQLPGFTQTHVHRVGDAIQPSRPLSSPSPPAPNPSQHQSLFQWVNSSHEVAKVLEFQL